jgi:hypothetical protein
MHAREREKNAGHPFKFLMSILGFESEKTKNKDFM